jgi:hypothetical protein
VRSNSKLFCIFVNESKFPQIGTNDNQLRKSLTFIKGLDLAESKHDLKAGMRDLKSLALHGTCGFDSLPGTNFEIHRFGFFLYCRNLKQRSNLARRNFRETKCRISRRLFDA